jgi:hypothetical protein
MSPSPTLTASLLRDDAEQEFEKRCWALILRMKKKVTIKAQPIQGHFNPPS